MTATALAKFAAKLQTKVAGLIQTYGLSMTRTRIGIDGGASDQADIIGFPQAARPREVPGFSEIGVQNIETANPQQIIFDSTQDVAEGDLVSYLGATYRISRINSDTIGNFVIAYTAVLTREGV